MHSSTGAPEPTHDRRGTPSKSTSVVICAYTLDRWEDLTRAVRSVLEQKPSALEIILVTDHNDGLARRAANAWADVRVVPSRGTRGLSGARNTGVEEAAGDIVAFLDDDAEAEPGWLGALVAPYADEAVVATGGHAEAVWDTGRPDWFPPEFDWVVGCSYVGLPRGRAQIRNPIGATMAFRRAAVLEAGGFRSDVGRVGAKPTGGEETELCIRIQRERPNVCVVLVPEARVRHRVPAKRATFSYFRERCIQEGRSKARIAELEGARSGLSSERAYVLRTLPAAVVRELAAALHIQPAGLKRAAAILTGLTLTTAGYLVGRIGIGRPREAEPTLDSAAPVRRIRPGGSS